MRCTTARVVSLKTRQRPNEGERSSPPAVPPEAALDHACVKDGNYCRCWMAAWFLLAERVGAERRQAQMA